MGSDATDKYWSDYYSQGLDFISINSQELKQVLRYVPKSAPNRALDIGCGTGQLTRDLYVCGYKTVGVDVSTEGLRTAHSLSKAEGDELCYFRRDIEKQGLDGLPFAPYGLITCQSVYAFIRGKKKLLGIVSKVLAPDGVFVIISMLDKNAPQHKRAAALNPKDTRSVLEKHFKVVYYEKASLGYFVCSAMPSA